MTDDLTRKINRRQFLGTASLTGLTLLLARKTAFAATETPAAPSSANEVVRIALIGAGDRGAAIARGFAAAANCQVGWVCEVDQERLAKTVAVIEKMTGHAPVAVKDFRTILENPDLDAVAIATPTHWHTAAAILALKAGKHVYVEKPAGHNPREGELLAEAQAKYGHLVQMGNQQRSHPETIEAIKRIHDGIIGRPYQARGWFVSARESIGHGKPADVPPGLDYELWQGPAPRKPYRDNILPYNWHWFRHWGGGELANNGTHELDIARWAMAAEFPEKVGFSGGRYHWDDDWEFADTQDVTFDFPGKKSIVWTGRSCNPMPINERGRGVSVHGTNGTVILDRDGYVLYDLKGKEIERHMTAKIPRAQNPSHLDDSSNRHIANFIAAIRTGEPLNSPIAEGRKSVLLPHLGNIAQFHGSHVTVDPASGHIKDNPKAEAAWSRQYEPGWEPTL